jgi:hypothetical protein
MVVVAPQTFNSGMSVTRCVGMYNVHYVCIGIHQQLQVTIVLYDYTIASFTSVVGCLATINEYLASLPRHGMDKPFLVNTTGTQSKSGVS